MAERHRQRRVFGVDREQALGFAFHQIHHELAPDHQRFLVGERDRLPCLERRQRRSKTRRPDQSVQDEIGVGLPRDDLRSVGADDQLDALHLTELGLDVGGGVLVRDGDEGGEELADLTHQELLVHPGRRQPHDLEPLRMPSHHVERLGPDGPGRAEDGDRPHGDELTPRPSERCEPDVT